MEERHVGLITLDQVDPLIIKNLALRVGPEWINVCANAGIDWNTLGLNEYMVEQTKSRLLFDRLVTNKMPLVKLLKILDNCGLGTHSAYLSDKVGYQIMTSNGLDGSLRIKPFSVTDNTVTDAKRDYSQYNGIGMDQFSPDFIKTLSAKVGSNWRIVCVGLGCNVELFASHIVKAEELDNSLYFFESIAFNKTAIPLVLKAFGDMKTHIQTIEEYIKFRGFIKPRIRRLLQIPSLEKIIEELQNKPLTSVLKVEEFFNVFCEGSMVVATLYRVIVPEEEMMTQDIWKMISPRLLYFACVGKGVTFMQLQKSISELNEGDQKEAEKKELDEIHKFLLLRTKDVK